MSLEQIDKTGEPRSNRELLEACDAVKKGFLDIKNFTPIILYYPCIIDAIHELLRMRLKVTEINSDLRDYKKCSLLVEQLSEALKQAESRIRQLESELKEQKALIPWIGELAQARVRIKELQEERDGYKNGQEQLQQMVSDLMDVNAKWAEKVRELEKGIAIHEGNL